MIMPKAHGVKAEHAVAEGLEAKATQFRETGARLYSEG